MTTSSDDVTGNDQTPTSESPKPNDEAQHLSGSKLYALALALLLTAFVLTLDMSIMATAIPKITDDFHTINDIGWYGAGYLTTLTSLQPTSGRIYTHFSLKPAYLTFLAVFAVGSLLCGTAVSSTMLIVGRAIAGMGGSGIINGAMTIIGVEAPPEKRPILLGLLFALSGLGQVVGPLLGGALTQHATWRWCFYINLPVTALTAASLFLIRFTGQREKKTVWTLRALVDGLDLYGFALFAPACVMLLLALQWGGVLHRWDSATIIGLLVGSAVLAVVFIIWERHAGENAMIPPALISRRVIAASCATSFVQGGGLILLSYYLPLWFQVVDHASPTTSAVRTLPVFISQVIFTVVSSVLIQRFLYLAPLAIVGNVLGCIGSALMTTFTLQTAAGKWIGYQVLVGSGRGLGLTVPFLAVQAYTPKAQLSVATAVVAFSQFFGGALFIAFGQTAFANLLRQSLTRFAPDVNQEIVVEAGATDYVTNVPADQQRSVLRAYNRAIVQTFYLAVAAAAVAVFTAAALGAAKTEQKIKKKNADADADAEKVESKS